MEATHAGILETEATYAAPSAINDSHSPPKLQRGRDLQPLWQNHNRPMEVSGSFASQGAEDWFPTRTTAAKPVPSTRAATAARYRSRSYPYKAPDDRRTAHGVCIAEPYIESNFQGINRLSDYGTRTHPQQSRAQKFQASPKSCFDEAAVRDVCWIGFDMRTLGSEVRA
ncbi:hypothetical protein HPB50_015023 [Hyalomma asiaticum]|uniref:Uncharacterized protein n=1 Tax=Hyalomma asiaticum TaxID=266040 RepID=A0ACB7SQM4_HYAAI|nr:hypothetical protein HPB50_015023 [Hyalomma asiaticum]